MAQVENCRGLTSDCADIAVGDLVYVDFAGFVWPKQLVDENRERHPFLIGTMGMWEGVYLGPRRLLGFIPAGTLVRRTGGIYARSPS